ncbi:hypothetical protein GGI43DRAFT_418546 [Trichoderma evansii]
MSPRIVICSSKSDVDTVPSFTMREFEVPLRLNNATESHLPLITNNTQLLRLETARSSVPLPDGKLRAFDASSYQTPLHFHT